MPPVCPLPGTNIPPAPLKEEVLSFLGGLMEVRRREVKCWILRAGEQTSANKQWQKNYRCETIAFPKTPSGRWKRSVKLTGNDALAAKLGAQYAGWSGRVFQQSFDDGMLKSRRDWKMSRVLADPLWKRNWALDYGTFHVPIRPKADETLAQFRARKGYFLWINPDDAVIPGKQVVGRVKADDGTDYYLYATYYPTTNEVTFGIRVDTPGMAEGLYEGLKDLPGNLVDLGKILTKLLCDKVFTNQELLTIMQTANSVVPGIPVTPAQQAAQAWVAAGAVCGIAWPQCVPAEIPAPPATFAPPWWERKEVLYAAGGLAALVAIGVVVKAARSSKAA